MSGPPITSTASAALSSSGPAARGRFSPPCWKNRGISVKVIDNDRDHCRLVASRLKKGIVLYGDGTDIDLLKQEGVEDADIVICITSDERLNMMMALLAKHLGARQTIVRVVRTEYVALMQQVGVDIVLATRLLAAGEVLSFVRSGSIDASASSKVRASRLPKSSCRKALRSTDAA